MVQRWPKWFCHQTRLKVNPAFLKVNCVCPIECFVALMVAKRRRHRSTKMLVWSQKCSPVPAMYTPHTVVSVNFESRSWSLDSWSLVEPDNGLSGVQFCWIRVSFQGAATTLLCASVGLISSPWQQWLRLMGIVVLKKKTIWQKNGSSCGNN